MRLRCPVVATLLCGFGGMLFLANGMHRFVGFMAYICVLSGGFIFGHYVAKGAKEDA